MNKLKKAIRRNGDFRCWTKNAGKVQNNRSKRLEVEKTIKLLRVVVKMKYKTC